MCSIYRKTLINETQLIASYFQKILLQAYDAYLFVYKASLLQIWSILQYAYACKENDFSKKPRRLKLGHIVDKTKPGKINTIVTVLWPAK